MNLMFIYFKIDFALRFLPLIDIFHECARRTLRTKYSDNISSFVFNHEMENFSSVKKYSHWNSSKPYPPPLLTRLPLTTAFPLLVPLLRNFSEPYRHQFRDMSKNFIVISHLIFLTRSTTCTWTHNCHGIKIGFVRFLNALLCPADVKSL